MSEDGPAWDVIDLDEALKELSQLNERQARIIELRFFAGLTVEEMEPLLGISERTLRREWSVARAWLLDRMSDSPNNEE